MYVYIYVYISNPIFPLASHAATLHRPSGDVVPANKYPSTNPPRSSTSEEVPLHSHTAAPRRQRTDTPTDRCVPSEHIVRDTGAPCCYARYPRVPRGA